MTTAVPAASPAKRPSGGAESGHMAQLDTVRAFAVGCVLLRHFVATFGQRFEVGGFGVHLFFVISGFLITGILLRNRTLHEQTGETRGILLRQFYVRRFLRIFPLYYVFLGIMLLAGLPHAWERLPWNALYLNNTYFPLTNTQGQGQDEHFWSLSVEEQFYLVWPFLIQFLPRKLLPASIIAMILLAPALRVTFVLTGVYDRLPSIWQLTPLQLDSLGLGALLAYWSTPGFANPKARERLVRLGFWIGVPTTLVALAKIAGPQVDLPVTDLAAALTGVWIVGRSATGVKGRFKAVMNYRPLQAIGKISYGIYIYHMFARDLSMRLMHDNNDLHDWHRFVRPFAAVVMTLAIAIVSYLIFEKPISDLKRFFPYRVSPGAPGQREPAVGGLKN